MAYWITRFATVDLETATPVHDVGLPQARGEVLALPGGSAYDPLGSEWGGVSLPYQVQVQAELIRSSLAEMQTAWYALRALHGQRQKLYRTPDGGTANSEWVWARLVQLAAGRKGDQLLVLPFSATFSVETAVWHGTAHNELTTLSTSPKTIAVSNAGNARVTDALLTITAGSVAITQVKVGISGVSEIQWAGTLAVGAALVIDCGALSVKKAGVDAYSGFSLTANHKIDDWLRLEAGSNSVVVTLTGGSTDSTFRIQFNDGWA